jgi:putative membrane protein
MIRPVYFFILISHILLTAIALPIILATLFFALTGRFASHRRIARFTFPAWLYISVTGVLIFFMLRAFS